jgi:GT2 family glycosyltransferase
MIRNDFADLRLVLIENPKNFGFAKAINQGIAASKGEFVFALNMDVVLEPDYIEKLVSAMGVEEIGSATGKLYRFSEDWGGRKIIDSTGHIFLASESVINRGEEEEDTGQYDSDKAIFGVCAAAAMYKREMFEDLKMGGEYFDEDFFVSFEDVDLDWRANLRGWKSIYVPEAFAHHKRYGTNWPLDEKLLINSKRNKLLLVIKNDFAFDYLLNFPFVFAYGFEDFLYNHFKNYRFVIGSFIRFIAAFPWAIRKRFIVKKMRRITFSDFRRHVNITGKDFRKLLGVTGTFITVGILSYFFGVKNTLLFAVFVFLILNPAVFYLKKLAEKPGE